MSRATRTPSTTVTASHRPTTVTAPTVVSGTTHLDVAETAFRLLCTDPGGLAVDGRRLGHGLPRRRILLTELSSILMHPATDFTARDEAWRLLVARSRTAGPAWVVGAVGVALPGLRAAAHRLGGSRTVDVQAELLIGFLAGLRTVETAEARLCPRLCNTAFVAARAALRGHEPAASGEANFAPRSAMPPAPFGHPDFVLARAVAAAVISPEEADLIGATRLEDVSLTDYATRVGQPRWSVYKQRIRAENRLAAAIGAGWVGDPDTEVITEATMTVVLER